MAYYGFCITHEFAKKRSGQYMCSKCDNCGSYLCSITLVTLKHVAFSLIKNTTTSIYVTGWEVMSSAYGVAFQYGSIIKKMVIWTPATNKNKNKAFYNSHEHYSIIPIWYKCSPSFCLPGSTQTFYHYQ